MSRSQPTCGAAVATTDDVRQKYEPVIDPGAERDRYSTIFDPTWADYRSRVF